MPYKSSLLLIIALHACLILSPCTFAASDAHSQGPPAPKGLILAEAGMCEDIVEQEPRNMGIAFSVGVGRLHCFTSFDPVPEKVPIYHNWYYGEKLSTKIKLWLKPPRWATFSTIQLREADKGPWRVEIADQKGKIIRVLRFSIID